jgi:hypothetical protein
VGLHNKILRQLKGVKGARALTRYAVAAQGQIGLIEVLDVE